MLSDLYKEILQLLKCSRRFSRTLLAAFYKLVNVISRIKEILGRPNNIFLKNIPIIESSEAISTRFIGLFSYVTYQHLHAKEPKWRHCDVCINTNALHNFLFSSDVGIDIRPYFGGWRAVHLCGLLVVIFLLKK